MPNQIVIEYCPKCGWLLRAAYMAQELLTTFTTELDSVTLKPSATGGRYHIYLNDALLFDRHEASGFPEIKTLKQWVRDRISPGKDLGHSDR
ncbi:SelT/SelW/SelH family protein [Compostibacter hankyongensis]|uniref:SelT/SelW/SelH family protein n=1 Tax=Compostibacter hankyongensis TaxID=1007089 RepID=A0ABP8FKK8_9BACT